MLAEERATGWLKETQKGYIRIAVLILLNKKAHHGYEMMKVIEGRTNGFWKPTAGGIYPILQDLENSQYITGEWDCEAGRKRKVYSITVEGKKVLEHTLSKERQLVNTMAGLLKEYMKDVLYVDINNTLLPKTPVAMFLEEDKCNLEDTKKILENKRLHIKGIIKKLQKNLDQIDKRIVQIEKETEHKENKK